MGEFLLPPINKLKENKMINIEIEYNNTNGIWCCNIPTIEGCCTCAWNLIELIENIRKAIINFSPNTSYDEILILNYK